MAAPIRSKLFPNLGIFSPISSRCICSTNILNAKEVVDQSSVAIDDDYVERKRAEIEKKRDVCRLPPRVEPLLKSRARRHEPVQPYDLDIRKLRKEYARLGAASGIDPSIMWPTVEEIKKLEAWEAEWEPSLEERFQMLEDKKSAEQDYIKSRSEEVAKNLANMPKLMKSYQEKLKKKDILKLQQETKRAKLLEEAREFFGYEIDPRDPKFQEMSARKEEEAKLALKKEKRAKRLASKMATSSS